MRLKQIGSCFLGYFKKVENSIICILANLNAHISKWIFLAYALFWRTRSQLILSGGGHGTKKGLRVEKSQLKRSTIAICPASPSNYVHEEWTSDPAPQDTPPHFLLRARSPTQIKHTILKFVTRV